MVASMRMFCCRPAYGLVAALLFLPAVMSVPIHARNIDLAKVDVKKSIDLRNDKSEDAWRMLVFMARDSAPHNDSKTGHAYVAAMKWRADIRGFVATSVFGAYPYGGDNSKGILDFIDLDGDIQLDPLDQSPDAALLVWVDKQQLAKALHVRDKWQRQKKWSLLIADCVTMFRDVAKAVGVKLPPRRLTKPYPYLVKVLKAN